MANKSIIKLILETKYKPHLLMPLQHNHFNISTILQPKMCIALKDIKLSIFDTICHSKLTFIILYTKHESTQTNTYIYIQYTYSNTTNPQTRITNAELNNKISKPNIFYCKQKKPTNIKRNVVYTHTQNNKQKNVPNILGLSLLIFYFI